MLTTQIKLAEKYNYLSEKFQKAFYWLKNTDLDNLEIGDYSIEGMDIYANVQEYISMPSELCKYESHQKYFDIQYVVEGMEYFGYENIARLSPATKYDEEKDIVFYHYPSNPSGIVLGKNDFAIVAPEDAHQPRVMVGKTGIPVKKIVVKVKV